jgi:hypothetical protein
MLKRLSIVLYSVLVSVAPCFATTVVVLVEPERILIGTDSLWNGAESCLRCKINTQFDDCTYVIVGMRKDLVDGFNANLYAARACGAHSKERLTLEQTAKRFVELAKLQAESGVDRYRQDGFPLPLVEVVFAGFESGKPVVATVEFLLNETSSLSERLCVLRGPNPLPTIWGYKDSAQKFVDSLDWQSALAKDHGALIRKLIGLEAADQPQQVALPASILEITKNSRRFLEGGFCDLSKKEIAGFDDSCPSAKDRFIPASPKP